ncbi:hypothetical protein C8J56DRAFT_1169749 [Mycena floridula]|nr:hypothetical protein C8J56DRAFT_1169749 [Mycena floridula]
MFYSFNVLMTDMTEAGQARAFSQDMMLGMTLYSFNVLTTDTTEAGQARVFQGQDITHNTVNVR